MTESYPQHGQPSQPGYQAQPYPQPQPYSQPQPGYPIQAQPGYQSQPYQQPGHPPYAQGQGQPGYQPQPYSQPYQPQPGYQPQPYLQPQPGYRPQPYPQAQPYSQPYPQPNYQPFQPQPYSQSQLGYPFQPQPMPMLSAESSPPAVRYKKAVRKTVMFIAIAMILFYVINFTASTIILLVNEIISGSLAEALSAQTLGESVPMLGIISIVAIALGSLAFLLVRGKKLFTIDLIKVGERIKGKELLIMAGTVMGIQAVFTIIGFLMSVGLEALQTFSGTEVEPSVDPFASMINIPGMLYIVFLGPIFEEIMFRGAVLRSLEPYGKSFAIVLSSLLFGVYHLVLFQGVFAFFVGLVLAYCALRYSLKWAILLHVMNNALSFFPSFLNASAEISWAIMFFQLAMGLIVIMFVIPRFSAQRKTGKPTPVPVISEAIGTPWENVAAAVRPRPFAAAFTSPLLIVGLSIAAIMMALMGFIL